MPNSEVDNPVYQPNFSSCSALLSEWLSFLWFLKKRWWGSASGQACLTQRLPTAMWKPQPLVQEMLAIPGVGTSGSRSSSLPQSTCLLYAWSTLLGSWGCFHSQAQFFYSWSINRLFLKAICIREGQQGSSHREYSMNGGAHSGQHCNPDWGYLEGQGC